MSEPTRLALFGLVVLITHCLEGITGFGCTVLALPFAVLLLGLKTAVPVLVALAWLLAAYIILRSWRNIRWPEFGFIGLYAGLGLPLGIVLFDYCPEKALKLILALFMVGVGFFGLKRTRAQRAALEAGETPPPPGKNWLMRGLLCLGGIIHGAFGTGGPFVVIYAARALTQKTLFRVTLCLLWFTLNTLLLVKWTVGGQVWNPETGWCLGLSLPFLGAGMLLGDYLHHRVNEYVFKLLVYFVLLASGGVMGYSTLA